MALPLIPLALGAAVVAALAFASSKSSAEVDPNTKKFQDAETNLIQQMEPAMPPDLVQAVVTALAHENDPNKLRAFAGDLRRGNFPRAAGLLETKASQIEAQRVGPAPVPLVIPPSGPIPFQPPIPAPAGPVAPAVFNPPAPPPPLPVPLPLPLNIPSPSSVLGPIPFPLPGSKGRVTTNDPGAAGALNLRSAPSTSASSRGMMPKDSTVTIVGPLVAGFLPVTSDVLGGPPGFASAQFITAANPQLAAVPLPLPAPPFDFPGGPIDLTPTLFDLPPGAGPSAPFPQVGSTAIVTTHDTGPTGNLNLRATPTSTGRVLGGLPHASSVTITGPLTNGFYPVSAPIGQGYASAQFLGPANLTTAGYSGPVPMTQAALGRDELHQTALALDTALKTQTCRAFNEPVVRRFQAAASKAGLYAGQIDGWYGTKAQAALGQVVGNPSPPCFPEPSGGPVNPNSYWSPLGGA